MRQNDGASSPRIQVDDDQTFDRVAEVERILATDPENSARAIATDRLHCVIDLSSDYFWELDKQFRVSQVWYREEHDRQRASALLLGKARWELGGVPLTGSWEEHRAVLEAHEAFDNLLVAWREANGVTRFTRSAGRPHFDAQGDFLGYVGITQDVSKEIYRQKLTALQVSLSKLFAEGNSKGQLRSALSIVCSTLGWNIGRCWELDVSAGAFRLIESVAGSDQATSGAPDFRASVRNTNLIGDPFEKVSQSRQLVWIPGASDSGNTNNETGQYSGVLVPLIDTTEIFRVLEFGASNLGPLSDELATVMSYLAMQLSAARDREQALERLKANERQYASTVELAAIGICHIALDGRIIHVNQQMSEILQHSKDELLTKTVREISHPEDRDVSKPYIDRLFSKEIESFRMEKRYLRKDGNPVWVRINTAMNRDSQGNPLHHISVVEDITERKEAEARIEYLATHDGLTGLPNRALFSELLGRAIRDLNRRENRVCAVLFIDLDRFKAINDSLGHQTGDAVLQAAAVEIQKIIRTTDCVSRFGGDEFVVLLNDLNYPSDAETVARSVLATLQKPFRVRGHDCRVTASIGVAACPDDGADEHMLMRNADTAMYAAKQSGRNDIQRYSSDMTTMSVKQLNLEAHLRRGIQRKEFRIQYQPRVDAKSGKVVGAEALLRWWNSELGTIPPVHFVPVAEESDLIIPMGHWVMRDVCSQGASWQGFGQGPISVGVNLSPKQFRDPDLVAEISASLEASGLSPENLALEIAEATWMEDIEGSIAIAKSLRALNVSLGMDNFGTAYSALAELQRLPLDMIKIDRSVVRGLLENEESHARITDLIAMGKAMGVSIVAEGVESQAQSTILSELGCDQLQGYYFGKACHHRELSRLLREGVFTPKVHE